MKNNKGLTLVELLAVLIILSLIIMVVTPSVTKNLKLSRVELCEHQLESLVSASKNWLTDQMNDKYDEIFVNDVFQSQLVSGETLLNEGYVSELEDDYKDVEISITKVGNNYEYKVVNQEQYCK